MKHVVVPRSPRAGYFLLAVTVAGQFALSYPAATDPAYDPIDPFWEAIAPYLGLLGVLLFPLFDDDRRTRRIVRTIYSVGASLSLGWVHSNAMSPVPHSSNLLLAALLALLIGIPVYLVVWVVEKGAASVWTRWREFADETPGKRRARFRFSLAALLGMAFLAALVCAAVRCYLTRPATGQEVHWTSRYHLRQLLWAMRAYHDLHGSFPYSEQGAGHAMYQLRDLVDVSVFDAAPRKKPTERAFWDHQEKCVRNCDFDYLNEPGFELAGSSYRVIMMTKPSADPRRACLAFLCLGDGTTTRHHFPAPPDSSVLGNWLWVDSSDVPNWLGHELLFTDTQVFTDWVRTHGTSGRASYSMSQDGKTTRVGLGGNTIDYKYEQGRLIGFTISTSEGQIEETITTDKLGRIIAITRRPDNWQSLLPKD